MHGSSQGTYFNVIRQVGLLWIPTRCNVQNLCLGRCATMRRVEIPTILPSTYATDSANGAKRMLNHAGVIMLLNNVPTEGYIHVQHTGSMHNLSARDAHC